MSRRRKQRTAGDVDEMVATMSQVRLTERLKVALTAMGVRHYGSDHLTICSAKGQMYAVFALPDGGYQVSLIDARGNVALSLEQVISMTVGIKDEEEMKAWKGA